MANWLLKSKVIAHEQSLNIHYTYRQHNYYPILWPLHLAIQYTIQTGTPDEVAKWTSAFILFCFFILLFKSLQLLKVQQKHIWPSMLIFTAFFITDNPINSALPENAFLTLLTGLIATSLLWLENLDNRKLKAMMAILALGLSLIKLEGSFATLFVAIALLCSDSRHSRNRTMTNLIFLMVLTITLPV
jgi:hypothetical protein